MIRAHRITYRGWAGKRPVLWWLRQKPLDPAFKAGMAAIIEAWKHPISQELAP